MGWFLKAEGLPRAGTTAETMEERRFLGLCSAPFFFIGNPHLST